MTEYEIFVKAIEIDDLQRRAEYVESVCAGNTTLYENIKALIAVHDRTGDFLNEPALKQMASELSGQNISLGETTSDNSDTHANLDLSFLQASSEPGSLGKLLHYEIQSVIGHGGCGIVLQALDTKLNRIVAVKVMHPHLAATSPARKRFLREAHATAAIRHENVVNIYAVEEQPIPFLVMEFIEGETLQQMLDRTGPLELPDFLKLAASICSGLEAAHKNGVIHRDIKPANILIEQATGRVKITDFGLARTADDASLTQSECITGTPMYMSPEQAQGKEISTQSDLFSLGSVLYLMCSGRPPFRAETGLAVMKRVVEDRPRPIRQIIPETPGWVEGIIYRLLEKNPESTSHLGRGGTRTTFARPGGPTAGESALGRRGSACFALHGNDSDGDLRRDQSPRNGHSLVPARRDPRRAGGGSRCEREHRRRRDRDHRHWGQGNPAKARTIQSLDPKTRRGVAGGPCHHHQQWPPRRANPPGNRAEAAARCTIGNREKATSSCQEAGTSRAGRFGASTFPGTSRSSPRPDFARKRSRTPASAIRKRPPRALSRSSETQSRFTSTRYSLWPTAPTDAGWPRLASNEKPCCATQRPERFVGFSRAIKAPSTTSLLLRMAKHLFREAPTAW